MKRVGIVGGGVAGLMAAWELSRLGFSVDLFEGGSELGGLASAFDFDGIRIERFYHFICRNDVTLIDTCRRLGLGDKLLWKPTRTGFFHEGRAYKFGTAMDLLRFRPLTLLDKARFGLNVLHSRQFTSWPRLEDRPAKRWLIERLGERAYSVIWDPLLRVKFDQYHEQVSAAWMWHRIHRVATSRRSVLHRQEFGHLVGGSDTLIRTLECQAVQAGARVHRNAPAQGLWTEQGKCRGLVLDPRAAEAIEAAADGAGAARSSAFRDSNAGGSADSDGSTAAAVATSRAPENGVLPFDYVICALPLPVFCRLMPRDELAYRTRLESIRFIGVVCMILRLREALTPNFWLNINDRRISFNGVIEYSNLYGREAYQGRSILYVPFYLEQTRPRYSYSDEQLFDEYVEALQFVQPRLTREWVEGYRVFRAPFAQPICHTHFSEVVPSFETPWDSCYLIEPTQLYPADRVISGTLRLAQDVVLRILDRQGMADRAEFARRAPEEIPA